MRLAIHRDPSGNLRPYCSCENSQVWRRARRKRHSDGRADFRLHRACAWYNGHPAAYQHDPVGSRAVASAFHRTKGDRVRRRQIKVTVPGMWTKMPGLNKFASLQVGDKRNRMYLIVVTGAKADVPKLTLQTYDQLTCDEAQTFPSLS
jgi:hypothetical protein